MLLRFLEWQTTGSRGDAHSHSSSSTWTYMYMCRSDLQIGKKKDPSWLDLCGRMESQFFQLPVWGAVTPPSWITLSDFDQAGMNGDFNSLCRECAKFRNPVDSTGLEWSMYSFRYLVSTYPPATYLLGTYALFWTCGSSVSG